MILVPEEDSLLIDLGNLAVLDSLQAGLDSLPAELDSLLTSAVDKELHRDQPVDTVRRWKVPHRAQVEWDLKVVHRPKASAYHLRR